ncbi:MAG: ribonuclease HII [Gemmatimonadota bacterium]|nr:ribonuclease HII [Gemmatimonadota bacterium]MDH5759162.1 ribonuclease HII [Gemmatimonadota bacterium]
MPERKALLRPRNLLDYERRFWGRGLLVAGVDEVGRGPLAGPVVVAAVILEPETHIPGADDSKKLSRPVREALCEQILAAARQVSLGAASVREIDRINILQATTLAMNRALAGLTPGPDHVVVDGKPVRHLRWDHEAVVGGDGAVHSIACASIVAKVVRDRLMRRLDRRYPGYGWERNAGYGTAEHRKALEGMGPTPHHRLTFAGVQLDLPFGDRS